MHEADYEADPDRIQRAKQARHPWRRQTRLQKKIRINRAFDRAHDLYRPLVRLTVLNEEEQQTLQRELNEMVEFAAEFEQIREAVDVFLAPAPTQYPTIVPYPDPKVWLDTYDQFSKNLERLGTHTYADDQAAVDTLMNETASLASALREPDLQPLTFKRPMQPGVATFALLFSRQKPDEAALCRKYSRMGAKKCARRVQQELAKGESYTFALAIVVQGKIKRHPTPSDNRADVTPAKESDDREPVHSQLRINPKLYDQFTPTVRPGLYYVNYPHTPFVPPARTSVMLFPVEFGEDYQEHQFLLRIINEQQIYQQEKFQQVRQEQAKKAAREPSPQDGAATGLQEDEEESGTSYKEPRVPDDVSRFFPRNAPLGTARISSEVRKSGIYDFYLHLPIRDRTPPMRQNITSVLGFHEHATGYSYARIGFDGTLLEIGNLIIPEHVLPRAGDRFLSDNYAYETALAMIKLACRGTVNDSQVGSIVGVETTTWKKQHVQLSRTLNRIQFTRPSQKIVTILKYKALYAGLPQVHTPTASPHRCSKCRRKRDPSSKNSYPLTQFCPSCNSSDLEATDELNDEIQCGQCKQIWLTYEPWFKPHNRCFKLQWPTPSSSKWRIPLRNSQGGQ